MGITSFSFILFVLATTTIYWLLPKGRKIFSLLVSYFFYACYDVKSTFFLMATTIITFYAGILLGKDVSQQWIRKFIAIVVCLANIGVVIIFKYSRFLGLPYFQEAMSRFSLIVPLGISFYTFQAVGYIIDVYTKRIEPCRQLYIYALYIGFFPKIMQGPIEKTDNFLKQLENRRIFSYEKYLDSLVLIIYGFLKKLVLADRLAIVVNTVYNNLESYNSSAYLLAAIFYSFQIYYDFSGYTDIARGCAGLLGYDLVNNFQHPYLAHSIKDFWRRWHQSLTNWFTQYIYIPLGGSRKGRTIWIRNIVIVYVISGLWHGANWNFVLWGIIHALYQLVGAGMAYIKRSLFKDRNGENIVIRIINIVGTFLLVTFAWIVFRVQSLKDIVTIFRGIISFRFESLDWFAVGLSESDAMLLFILFLLMMILEVLGERRNLLRALNKQALPVRWLAYIVMILVIIMFGVYGELSEEAFIYLQF